MTLKLGKDAPQNNKCKIQLTSHITFALETVREVFFFTLSRM